MEAILALEDGTWFKGVAAGADGEARGRGRVQHEHDRISGSADGPVVLGPDRHDDLSRDRQLRRVPEDVESRAPQVAGFIMREESPIASNWRSEGTLRDYLVAHQIVAISDIDTRALTRRLRSSGVMRGVIVTGNALVPDALVERARSLPKMEGSDLVRDVTCKEAFDWPQEDPDEFGISIERRLPGRRLKIAAYDSA